MNSLVFLDTETTGLSLNDDIWEIAAVRREPDGGEVTMHLFVEHSEARCHRLPPEFRADHGLRWRDDEAVSRTLAAADVHAFTDGAHIVGAVPNFDTERLARMIRLIGSRPQWHYHLIDVENVVVGYLAAKGQLMAPPWNSDELSRAVGVNPEKYARHTAMGDVRWVMAQWDAVMGRSDASSR